MNENNDVQTFDAWDTTPESSEETEQDIETKKQDAVTPNSNDLFEENVMRDADATKAQKSASEVAAEPFVSVQYNHQNRNFTKEEAINFIQKGMHTEALRAKLEFLAKEQGTDVNSLVERIITAPEQAYRKHLEEMYGKGSPDVEIGMKIYRDKRSDGYKKLMQDGENAMRKELEINDINSRLADEYINLKAEMPNAPEYNALPDSVIREAAEGKRDLYSAYLRYLHNEKMKVEAAKKSQEAATTASSGSMGRNSADDMTSAERNFLSGLWGR